MQTSNFVSFLSLYFSRFSCTVSRSPSNQWQLLASGTSGVRFSLRGHCGRIRTSFGRRSGRQRSRRPDGPRPGLQGRHGSGEDGRAAKRGLRKDRFRMRPRSQGGEVLLPAGRRRWGTLALNRASTYRCSQVGPLDAAILFLLRVERL